MHGTGMFSTVLTTARHCLFVHSLASYF